MAEKTKERILKEALRFFSEKGYAGTSIQDIANRIGFTKTALYRHYKSKEDLLEALLNETECYYRTHFSPLAENSRSPASPEEFRESTLQKIRFTLEDEKIIQARKFLTIEQFRSQRIAELATKHFLTDLQNLYTKIFADFMERKIFKPSDPNLLALSFVCPITELIHLCDRSPGKKDEILAEITAWVDVFLSQQKAEKGGTV